MLVKHNLDPVKVISYVWRPMLYAVAVAVLALLLRLTDPAGNWNALPFAPVGALAAAMAIVIAFRANSAYQRWWEARTLWQNIVSNSRILGRQIVASTSDAIAAGKGGTPADVLAFRRDILMRVIAFCYTLRAELRETDPDGDLRRLLPAAEYQKLTRAQHRSNMLLTGIGVMVKEGVRAERIGTFDPITLEPNLAALNNWAAGVERIKTTPIPRQYSFFARLFIWVLVSVLPFGLVGLLPGAAIWWLVPLAVVLGGVFILLERSCEVIDTPFANTTSDVPMTALCTTIERDLREQLGQTGAELPPQPEPVGGYLW